MSHNISRKEKRMKKSTSTIIYLTLCVASCCLGMQPQCHSHGEFEREDPDELRKWVLTNTVLQKSATLATKIRTIIANRYTGMEDLTENEQTYLLKEYRLRDGKTQDLSYTKQVFFERFIAWSSLKNISKNLVSESENIPSINPISVLIDQILAKIESASHINYQNNCAPSVPQSEYLSTILPTEEIPFIIDGDNERSIYYPH